MPQLIMNAKVPILAAALIVVGAVVWIALRHSGTSTAESGEVHVSGNIEVTQADASFKLPGRVETREVTEGQNVKAGQVIARLEKADLAQEVSLRRAEIEQAKAVLAELEAGTRVEEVAQAEAALALAEAEAKREELEFNRQKELRTNEVSTQREFEIAEAGWKTSQARTREQRERLTLLRNGPRREQIDQARARVHEAQESLALAETRLGYTTLVSPLSGLVLSKSIEPGEYVAPGTAVVTIGDLDHPWLRAYISETDLGRVKVGQKAKVTADTYPDKQYSGTVSFISSVAEFTPKNVQTSQERVKLVYRIKVELENPNWELKPGMPADGLILSAR